MRLDEIIGSAPADDPASGSPLAVVQSAVGGALQNTVSVAAKLAPAGSNGSTDADAFFACLEVEQKLRAGLQPLFAAHGLRLEAQSRSYLSDEYRYTAVCDDQDVRAALLQLPGDVLRGARSSVVAQFVMVLKAFRELPARFLVAQESGLTRRFKEAMADEWRAKKDWEFVAWADIENTVGGRYAILKTFVLDARATAAAAPVMLSRADLKPVAEVLAMLATDAPIGARRYFEQRVKESDWPDPWKTERQGGWSEDANNDASALLNYAFSRSSYPAGHEKAGQSVLGWLLHDIVKLGTAGGDAQSQLSGFVIGKKLLRDAEALKLLSSKILS